VRARPIRSQIYLPVTRFGVVDTDWKFVFLITFTCYTVPFLFDLKIFRFPLELWASLAGLLASVAFFNYVRIGRKPFWLQHQITGRLRSARLRPVLPSDPRTKPWIVEESKKNNVA
jgi:hypothetical protein